MSYVVRLQQGTTIIDLQNITNVPITKETMLAEHKIPGSEVGKVQWMGVEPEELTVEGFVKGSKSVIDSIETFRANGSAVTVTINAHGQTWVSANYIIESLEYEFEKGLPNKLALVRFKITLRRI